MLLALGSSLGCGPAAPCSRSTAEARRMHGAITRPHASPSVQHGARAQRGRRVNTCQAASSAPAAAGSTTELGSPAWDEFAVAASGEWSGMCVTYCADGTAQELPYQYVPSAFREWDQVPHDWHTQCSSLADGDGLLVKLKRLMPIVGCEADAVAYTEDERRSLRTDDAHRGESKTVLPDGSYSTGPRLLRGLTRARVEHCLVKEPRHRARLVFNLKRFEASEPWTLENIEQHVERRDSDYAGGQPLAACGYSMSNLTGEPQLTAAELEGRWAVTSHAAFELDGENGFRDSSTAAPDSLDVPADALLLHGGAWCAFSDSSGGRRESGGSGGGLTLQAGCVTGAGECRAATRAFADDRLTGMVFTSAQKQS